MKYIDNEREPITKGIGANKATIQDDAISLCFFIIYAGSLFQLIYVVEIGL